MKHCVELAVNRGCLTGLEIDPDMILKGILAYLSMYGATRRGRISAFSLGGLASSFASSSCVIRSW